MDQNAYMDAPVIIIFGITGDLSKRKLLPAIYHLLSRGSLSPDTKIVGVSRQQITKEALLDTVRLCILERNEECDDITMKKVNDSFSTFQLDPSNDDDFKRLKAVLDDFDINAPKERIFYMSIPASAYEPIIFRLASHGLNQSRDRILLEKPFGYDSLSAEKSIAVVQQAFKENQIYRIDHYLAKETAQNLLTFRLHNPIFTPLWNGEHIQSIQVRQYETRSIEGRAHFYEQTGALRDMIQSHLMQLLALTMMDLPEDMSSTSIHFAKESFLRGLREADPELATRAQYDSYRDEVNNPNSNVETYVKLKLHHNSEHWRDTEIVVETGKGLDQNIADIVIEFKTPHERRRNSLTFQIQPNEGISLDLVVKEPGFNNDMRHTALEFRYDNVFKDYQQVDAYERVLMDAVHNDQALFASEVEVLENWRILQPIISSWQNSGDDLKFYHLGDKGDF